MDSTTLNFSALVTLYQIISTFCNSILCIKKKMKLTYYRTEIVGGIGENAVLVKIDDVLSQFLHLYLSMALVPRVCTMHYSSTDAIL